MKERSEDHLAYPTFLFVENDVNDVLLVSRAFSKCGIPGLPRFVEDASELRAYLLGAGKYSDREQYPLPKLIMTDYRIAGGSAREIIQCVRCDANFKNVPVIVFSSFLPPREVESILGAGASACLEKPVSFSEFCKTLHGALKFAQN